MGFFRRLFGIKEKPMTGSPATMICMRQDETWRWPAHLGARTAGECVECGAPIYFEAQHQPFRKVCNHCHPPILDLRCPFPEREGD